MGGDTGREAKASTGSSYGSESGSASGGAGTGIATAGGGDWDPLSPWRRRERKNFEEEVGFSFASFANLINS